MQTGVRDLTGMVGRYHRMGQSITPGAEPSSNGQKELEEFGEVGVRHLRAPSPRSLMMMMMMVFN